MKKLFKANILFFLSMMFVVPAFSQSISVNLNLGVFYLPGSTPYTELYFKIPAHSLKFKKEKKSYRGNIFIDVEYYNDSQTVFNKKYNLLTDPLQDTSNLNFFVTDLVRNPIPHGVLNLRVMVKDNNANGPPLEIRKKVITSFPEEEISLSEIELVDTIYSSVRENKFSRNNFDILPNVLGVYAGDHFYFYVEAYNLQKKFGKDPFYFNYFIKGKEGTFSRTMKQEPKVINYLIGYFNINELEGGTYELRVQVVDGTNKVRLQKDVKFDVVRLITLKNKIREDKKETPDSLFLENITFEELKGLYQPMTYLIPDFDAIEMERSIMKEDSSRLKREVYRTWRREFPGDPPGEWEDFIQRVDYVNEHFGNGIQKGYETDRGRVYVKYGPPAEVAESIDDPSAYPYQIWHYYSAGRQTNVKFIFYNPSRLPGEFVILHSNLTGEVRNDNWENIIKNRFRGNGNYLDFGSDPQGDFH